MTRPALGKLFVASPFIALLACLSSNPGQSESTDPASSSSDTSPGSSGESTLGGLMTTTEEPESEDSGGSASTGDETTDDATSGTTQVIPPECGDGNHDANEECDNGNQNANDAACTLACTVAVCGDGFVEAGKETCDDGVNDGSYGGCNANCMSFGPYCGDMLVENGMEECDDDDPDAGCLKDQCKYAKSCLELNAAWGAQAGTGMYPIHPKQNVDIEAWCEMDADEGGYTFVKVGGVMRDAAEAEAKCGTIGMRLLVPRTSAHMAATVAVAFDGDIPTLEGDMPPMSSDYLRVFGIYPKVVGESCEGQPLNKSMCPQWEASDGDAYWISDVSLGQSEPGTGNCANCSMAYYWTGMELTGYEVVWGGGVGAESTHFLCDVGDKRPMN